MRLPCSLPIRLAARAASAPLLAALLAACGGGGGDDFMTAPGSGSTLGGTVAVGAPMLNATVSLKDAKGVVVSAAVAADGSYSGLALDGLSAPFSLQACGFVDGNYGCYYAVVGQGGTGNVTPLTNATVALALGADPAALFAANGASAPPSAAALDAQIAKLKAALGDLLAKAGVGAADFATTPFDADRTGMDKLLDAVKVSTGDDGGKTFVQVEGKLGSGNAYLDPDSGSGALSAGSDLDVDLRGISHIFVDGLSHAIDAERRSDLHCPHDRRRRLRRCLRARHGQEHARRQGERPDHDLPLRRARRLARRRIRGPGAEGLRLHDRPGQ